MAAPDLVEEFENWWQNEETLNIDYRKKSFLKQWNYKDIADRDTLQHGTYCKVFQDYYQHDGEKCAIKYLTGTKTQMIELYFEYKTHLALWNLYTENNMTPRVIKPLWIKKVCFNRGFHCPIVAIGLERFENTMYEYLKHNNGDTNDSRRWKKEMITELKRAHKDWEFSHRDCHLMNIAIVNNDWRLFDLGMSKVSGYEPYKPKGGSAFYEYNEFTSAEHDERILRFSWNAYGDSDEWVQQQQQKMARSSPSLWKKNCPVVVKGHPLADNGSFIFVSEDGNVVVDLDVPETTKIKEITSKLRPPTKYEEVVPGYTLSCHFKKENVLPDILAEHIHYYFPGLK
jgi:hypothetical protein